MKKNEKKTTDCTGAPTPELLPNKDTELVFIIDRSGSMSGFEADTIGGFNSMIEKQKRGEGCVYVSTVLFDNYSEVLHDRIPITDIEPMTRDDYSVRGCTALLDAVGGAIHHIKNVHKYARPEDVPAHTIFIITTDGMENASRSYSYDKVKRMIEAETERGWEFIFAAANIDAIAVADSIGIRPERAANYMRNEDGFKECYAAFDTFVTMSRSEISIDKKDTSWKKKLEKRDAK